MSIYMNRELYTIEVKGSDAEFNERYIWCVKNFGRIIGNGNPVWGYALAVFGYSNHFYFKNFEDALLFDMNWSY